MSVEMFLFLKCMWFITKCILCFYGIYGLSYIIPIELIFGIKNTQKEQSDILSVLKNQ